MFKRILVATDGSVHSRRAALTAADLARALGASLTLLAVYQQPPGFEGEPDYSRDLEAALRGAQTLLEAEAAAIEADGWPPAETEAIGGQSAWADHRRRDRLGAIRPACHGDARSRPSREHVPRLGLRARGGAQPHPGPRRPRRRLTLVRPREAASTRRQRAGGHEVRPQPRLHVAVRTIWSWCRARTAPVCSPGPPFVGGRPAGL